MELIPNNDPTLSDRLGLCSEELDRDSLKEVLIECMENNNGVGLSANQIGISERAFVMYSDVKKREIIACFNPFITEYSEKKIVIKLDEIESIEEWNAGSLCVYMKSGTRLYVEGELTDIFKGI